MGKRRRKRCYGRSPFATRILKENLAGIYVHGSLAFGRFCFERSNIDFIVVTKRKSPLPLKCRLVQTLPELTRAAPAKCF